MDDGGGFGGDYGGPGMSPAIRDPRSGGMGMGMGMGGLGPGQLQGLAGALGLAGMEGHDARRDPRGMRIAGRDARDVRMQTGRDATRDGGGEKLEVIEVHGDARLAGRNTTLEPATPSISTRRA